MIYLPQETPVRSLEDVKDVREYHTFDIYLVKEGDTQKKRLKLKKLLLRRGYCDFKCWRSLRHIM